MEKYSSPAMAHLLPRFMPDQEVKGGDIGQNSTCTRGGVFSRTTFAGSTAFKSRASDPPFPTSCSANNIESASEHSARRTENSKLTSRKPGPKEGEQVSTSDCTIEKDEHAAGRFLRRQKSPILR